MHTTYLPTGKYTPCEIPIGQPRIWKVGLEVPAGSAGNTCLIQGTRTKSRHLEGMYCASNLRGLVVIKVNNFCTFYHVSNLFLFPPSKSPGLGRNSRTFSAPLPCLTNNHATRLALSVVATMTRYRNDVGNKICRELYPLPCQPCILCRPADNAGCSLCYGTSSSQPCF